MRHTLPAVLVTATAAVLLAACSTPAEPAPSHTTTTLASPTAAPEPEGDTAAPSIDPHELTELAIEITWASTSDTDKTSICDGLALFGTHWAAQQLQAGTNDDSGLDWDYAAHLIQIDCQQR